MKKNILLIGVIIIVYVVASKFFINLIPPTEEELVGEYESTYENKQYKLIILPDKTTTFEVSKNNNIIYKDSCKSYNLFKVKYRTFPIYNLSFNNCKKMDSNTILERGLLFNILIGNNGSELRRIDPDVNVYFKKIIL